MTTFRYPDPRTFVAIPRYLRNASALSMLHAAWEAAIDVQTPSSEFAVEIHQLFAAGVTSTDLRWLAARGFAEHLQEIVREDSPRRQFQRSKCLAFTDHSCFVLTEAGCRLASASLKIPAQDIPVEGAASTVQTADSTMVPKWDGTIRQLSVSGRLVKQFRLPATNQETILKALEEDGWPPRVDDPLPSRHGGDRRARLHDAIKGLNRNQIHRLLSFKGDGTGCGILWSPVAHPGVEA